MNRTFSTFLCAVLLAYPLQLRAAQTKTWSLETKADYEKSKLEKVAVRSDGKLALAPVFAELLDSGQPYLWAVAQDSKGNIYAGGGSPGASAAKLFMLDKSGKSKTLAELPGSEIHALAIGKGDKLFAATSPDGKIYSVSANGKFDVYYDPKAKYIWAIAFNSAGELFVATGDTGEIHKVTAAGKGSVFYKTEETHARSMVIDSKDNLIAGTEPGGLILRVTPNAAGFVLHQASKKEVTAVAVAKDGTIYAAAVGAKPIPLPPSPAPQPIPLPTPAGPAASPVAPLSFGPTFSGGSDLYRIDPDGAPSRIWSDAADIVYSIAIACDGKPILSTGNKGRIHRIDSDVLSTLLVASSSTQITQLAPGTGCAMLAAAANVGKVFRLGAELEQQGSVTSDALDASWFSQWGRLTAQSEGNGKVSFETRSGNTDRPGANWSPWSEAKERILSPAARFLQYKLTLNGDAVVSGIDIAYLARNLAPTVEEIEVTAANYRFPAQSSNTFTPSQTLNLPAMGQRRTPPIVNVDSGSSTMNYAKGFIGARWRATDRNGDSLQFKIEVKGIKETEWKLLKDKLAGKFHSWDTTAFADGEYLLRITASDQISNPEGRGLEGSQVSEPFLVDNTPPQISALTASANGNKIIVKFKAADALSLLQRAEYSINGSEWTVVEPTTRLTDSKQHDYDFTITKPAGSEFTISVRVSDEGDNQVVEKTILR